MKFNTFNFFLITALKDIKRNKTLTLTYIFTISATIFMFGLFAIFMMIESNTFTSLLSKDDSYSYKSQIRFFNITEFLVLMILVPISIFLIIHVIKMTMYCRRHEITTMKYLGATDSFIRGPFIISGLTLGLIGSLLGDILLYKFYTFIYNKLIVFDTPIRFLNPKFIVNSMIIPFIIAGTFIGAIGNILALKKLDRKNYK